MLGSSAGKLTCRRGVNDQNISKLMANKSPKSKQKSQSQKQTKNDAAGQAKQRQLASKAEARTTPPAKKK